MKHQEYVRTANRAAQLIENGNYERAIAILEGLIAQDISEIDKSLMCLNLAVVHDKLGQVAEALAWYDKGANFERPYRRSYVAESRAAYLAEQGRYQESYQHYEALLSLPALTGQDKLRIEQNLQVLLKRL